MSQQLLRRAWDALDSFKQAYPENWNEDDQQVMDDLLKADLDLSGVKRTWVSLTDEEIKEIVGPWGDTPIKGYTRKLFDQIEAKLKEKNNAV
jgi:hypothetical protein